MIVTVFLGPDPDLIEDSPEPENTQNVEHEYVDDKDENPPE